MGDVDDKISTLSARQKEVLRLAADHWKGKEIARLLKIEERTVKAHTEEARRRLGVSSTRDAALLLSKYEAVQGIGQDGQWPSGAIGKRASDSSSIDYEHDTNADQRRINPDMEGTGTGLLGHGRSGQEGQGGRSDHSVDTRVPHTTAAGGSAISGDLDRLVDSRAWERFADRLKSSGPLGWLGFILIIMFVGTFILSGFLFLTLGALEAMEQISRRAV